MDGSGVPFTFGLWIVGFYIFPNNRNFTEKETGDAYLFFLGWLPVAMLPYRPGMALAAF